MRIAYSFAGEGMGHAARTSVIGPLLQQRHDVVYFMPDAIREFVVSRMGEGRYERILHFFFEKKGERVRLFASIFSTIPLLARFPFEMIRLVERLRALKIDAVISDFDPFLPWAARMAGIPSPADQPPGNRPARLETSPYRLDHRFGNPHAGRALEREDTHLVLRWRRWSDPARWNLRTSRP